MVDDEKDRFGSKLHDVEKAIEDQWARQHDAELIDKLRKKTGAAMHCPQCGKLLVERAHGTVHLLACPDNDGGWVSAATLESLLQK